MQINFYNKYFVGTNTCNSRNTVQTTPSLLRQPECDSVSFSGGYSIRSIKKRTGRCAYCGTEVYNKKQLNELIDCILNNPQDKVVKHVENVIKLLAQPEKSTALAKDRREANKKSIEFFIDLKKMLEKNSSAKVNDLIKQITNENKSPEKILNEKLSPLSLTIDHVEPKRLRKKDRNSDAKLVESCQTCNRDLKAGMLFKEFYKLYPSIKDFMPEEKFNRLQNEIAAQKVKKEVKKAPKSEDLQSMLVELSALQLNKKAVKNSISELKAKSKEQNLLQNIEINKKQKELKALKTQILELKKNEKFSLYIKFLGHKHSKDELTKLREAHQELKEFSVEELAYYNDMLLEELKIK